MTFVYRRHYCGPIRLVIHDWAGTVVDFGCMAPAAVFVEGFRRCGVTITMDEARAPMGMEKRAHIRTIAEMPDVVARWEAVHGRPMDDRDVDQIYADFVPLLLDVLDSHSALIPGAREAMQALRERGIRIGGTTGYFDEAMERVLAAAARQEYAPDVSVCATQVSAGRPAPWMIYRVMNELECYPPEAVVKVGDTRPDIEAGLNAGVWTIGIAASGNQVGLTEQELAELAPAERVSRIVRARNDLYTAGAHLVIDTIADLPAAIDQIETQFLRLPG